MYLHVTYLESYLGAVIALCYSPTTVTIDWLIDSFIHWLHAWSPQQYLGAAMLLVALFLVLISNHMEERLADGKSVIRLDYWCKRRRKMMRSISSEQDREVEGLYEEKKSLLGSTAPSHHNMEHEVCNYNQISTCMIPYSGLFSWECW